MYPSTPGNFTPVANSPPVCQVSYVPQEYADRLVASAVAIERLRHRQEQQALREQAYKDLRNLNDRLCTFGPSGMPLQFLNQGIDYALHLMPLPPIKRPPIYIIGLTQCQAELVISEKDYANDARLVIALQELPGVEVTIQRSQKTTAMLLRQAISHHLGVIDLSLYAGWCVADGQLRYAQFSGHKPHQNRDAYNLPKLMEEQSSAAIAGVAAKQFWPVFEVIDDPFVRQVLMVWFHMAALSSLLPRLGVEIPLSLYLFAPERDLATYVEKLLAWFGDPPISLDQSSTEFSMALLSRKDQPLLVKDQERAGSHDSTSDILVRAVTTQTATWKSGKDALPLPLQAPLTILSGRASAISCLPEVMVLDIPPGCIGQAGWRKAVERAGNNIDYLEAFIAFTQAQIPALQTALDMGRKAALCMAEGTLSVQCLQMLSAVYGISIFLNSFFKFCAPDADLPEMLTEDMASSWLRLLEKTSEKEEIISVADQFTFVVRHQLRSGKFFTCPRTHYNPTIPALVCFDDDRLYFTSGAFSLVCNALAQSRPVVLRALTDAGLLCGPPVNATTVMTRIGVQDAQGKPHTVSVYAIDRAAIEDLGNPLPLGEEGHDGL